MPVFGGRLQAGDKGELSVEENGGKSNAHLGLEQDCVARDNPCNDGSLAGVCKLDNQGLPSSSSFSVEAGQPSGLSGQLPCEGADPGMHSFHLGVAGGDKQSAKPTDLPVSRALLRPLSLLKEEMRKIPLWVRLYGVPLEYGPYLYNFKASAT